MIEAGLMLKRGYCDDSYEKAITVIALTITLAVSVLVCGIGTGFLQIIVIIGSVQSYQIR